MDFSLFHWVPTRDSLYHYDEVKNFLESRFTVDWKNKEMIMHDYRELPNHYFVQLLFQSAFPGMPRHPLIVVNKSNLRGSYVNIKFDMLGNIYGPEELFFNRGYFVCSMYAYELKKQIEKALSRPEALSFDMKEKLMKFNNRLTEDDNNVIFLGKLLPIN